MRASPPSPSRTKIVGVAVPDVPFRAVLVLLCRGGRLCPPCMTAAPCRAGPVCPAVTGVGIRLSLPPSAREVAARSADGGRDATRFSLPQSAAPIAPSQRGPNSAALPRCRDVETPSPTESQGARAKGRAGSSAPIKRDGENAVPYGNDHPFGWSFSTLLCSCQRTSSPTVGLLAA